MLKSKNARARDTQNMVATLYPESKAALDPFSAAYRLINILSIATILDDKRSVFLVFLWSLWNTANITKNTTAYKT
jgi:hypothetical protein